MTPRFQDRLAGVDVTWMYRGAEDWAMRGSRRSMRKRQPSAKASGSETEAAMDPHPDDQTQTARRDPLRAARFEDAIVGVVIIAAAGLLYWATFYFRAVDWTPLGLAFWPRVLLAGLVLASLALMVLRQLDVHPRLPHQSRRESPYSRPSRASSSRCRSLAFS
jgi:hypothetical protein